MKPEDMLRHVALLFPISLLICDPAIWAQANRLSGPITATERVQLEGSVSPLAQPQFDQGPADPALKLPLITLGLKKTSQQKADLDTLLNQLQDLRSSQYHHFLTPEQYADRFGVSQSDIDNITGWLKAEGFNVGLVSRGRDYIVFSGTAGLVESALHTQIHRYVIHGEQHFANVTAPEIPAELNGLVEGFRGLNDFKPKLGPKHAFQSPQKVAGTTPKPQIVIDKVNYLVPNDLAAIYGISDVYAKGWDGTGQQIAIAGGSDIYISDIEAFRLIFGLPPNNFSLGSNYLEVLLAPPSADPGINGSLDEADLDIEWAGAVARGAQIIYVEATDPFYSAFYAIDNKLAPVLSTSLGTCEWHITPDDEQLFLDYSQKAAVLGISWVASSGDSGAAGCEFQGGPYSMATTPMSVEVPSSLPEVTAVGGSEFNGGNGSYWSTPGPNFSTASGYIPEVAWNDENVIIQELGLDLIPLTPGAPTEGGFAAGGGGASILFPKPQWQAGPGVPNDSARDVPDVAFTASWFDDPYLIWNQGTYVGVGGTSAATPVFAGVVAILNQYLVAQKIQPQAGLGNLNPMLYYLAQNDSSVFHDITVGNNEVPCRPGSSQDCGSSGSYGYSAGPGYDLVTGWGSVDAEALIGSWANAVTTTAMPQLEVTAFTASPLSVAAGGQVNISATIVNDGQGNAGAYAVLFYLSPVEQIVAEIPPLAQCNFQDQDAGTTVTCKGLVQIPSGLPSGTYYLIAVADGYQQLNESNRSGSVRLCDSGPITVK